MKTQTEAKSMRLLEIYTELSDGAVLNKAVLAQRFQVTVRSVQRDIEDLRCFLAEKHSHKDIIYDAKQRGYRLQDAQQPDVSAGELLAVCKILLDSRSLIKAEILPILDRLLATFVPEGDSKAIATLIANERYHYVEPHHGCHILPTLWGISQAVQNQRVLEITYKRMKEPRLVTRQIEPVGIMFSEFYFYLTAFLRDVDPKEEFENKDDLFPTIYRIDRIQSFTTLDKHFQVPYKDRFEEGEFRKRVQFMYGGKLEHIKFRYSGPSIEAVLDRLPTAQVISQDENGWVITAEVFGKGIEMWLRSQGEYVKLAGGD